MPYVTSFERYGMVQMLECALQAKFGEQGVALMPAILALDDAEKYLTLPAAIIDATTVEDVRRACEALAKPPTPRRKRKGSHSEDRLS